MTTIIHHPGRFDLAEYSSVRAEVRARLEQEAAGRSRGYWQRLKLWWRIERETSKELKRRHPSEDPHAI